MIDLDALDEKQKQRLRDRSIGVACLTCAGMAFFGIGFLRGTWLEALLEQVAKPLSTFFHYEVDPTLIMLSIAIVWAAVAMPFFSDPEDAGQPGQSPKAQARQEEKRRQRQEFAADLERIRRHHGEGLER